MKFNVCKVLFNPDTVRESPFPLAILDRRTFSIARAVFGLKSANYNVNLIDREHLLLTLLVKKCH